jgi:sulfoxide reductase heme-binding subunit YedZ
MKKLKWEKLNSSAYAAIFLSLLHAAILDKTWIIYAVIVEPESIIKTPFQKTI